MSRKRKYRVIVNSSVYCSSTLLYCVDVFIESRNRRDVRNFEIREQRILQRRSPATYRGYPQYVQKEIIRQLKELHTAGQIRVYEVDRYGERRWESLRYHVPEYFDRMIENMKE